jgi:hypothetical protein
VDADDVLADPASTLAALCTSLGISYDSAMLAWPAGPRATDGVWAPVWYQAVEQSTGFGAPPPTPPQLEPRLMAIADAARPHYERLTRYRI